MLLVLSVAGVLFAGYASDVWSQTPQGQNMDITGFTSALFADAQYGDFGDLRVFVFYGQCPVRVIPVPGHQGLWRFSRQYMFSFEMSRSSGSNWWSYAELQFPAGNNFTVAVQAGNFWGHGKPSFTSFRSGKDDFSQTITLNTPRRRMVTCGAYVPLSAVAISAGQSFNLDVTVNAAQLINDPIKIFIFRTLKIIK